MIKDLSVKRETIINGSKNLYPAEYTLDMLWWRLDKMAEFKIVLGFKNGKCVQREVKDSEAQALVGKKIGDKVEGSSLGLDGYELEVTGGSDKVGFPMRKDVPGSARKKVLTVKGVGVKKVAKGIKQRKTITGNTIGTSISQINLKVLKVGKEDLSKVEKKEGDAPAEGDAPKEEKKEEKPKEEAKPEEKKEEPKVEKKE